MHLIMDFRWIFSYYYCIW